MALALKLAKGAVDSGLAFYYLTDSTGVYNVSTNPGGYGNPPANPNRAALALYLYGYKYVKDSSDTAITINNTADPISVTQWQIPMTADGYSYFTLLAIQDLVTVTGAGNTVIGNLYYYSGAYYKALTVNNSNPSVTPTGFQLVTDLTDPTILAIANVTYTTLDVVTNYFGKQCLQTQMFIESRDNCNCDDNNRTECRPYQKVFSMLYTAGILCAQAKYAQADDMLVALSAYCSTLDCSTC